jgi:hypothetical protein
MDLKTVVRASPDQLASAMPNGEVALLNLPQEKYYGLNPTGAQVWQWLQEPTMVSMLVEKMVAAYDVGADECRRDVLELLDGLQKAGLIVARPGE